jgi:hypothetical protein
MAILKLSPSSSDPQFAAERKLDGPTVAMQPSSPLPRLPFDPLWTPEQVARELNVSPDWVRDHSCRKEPRLPVIRLGGGPGRTGLLRYRASQIVNFIAEMERLGTSSSGRI